MPLVVYEKAMPVVEQPQLPKPERPQVIFSFRLLPTFLSVVGLSLVVSVVWPVFSYEMASRQPQVVRTAAGLLNPIIGETTQVLADDGPTVIKSVDYTKMSNWFPTAPKPAVNSLMETPTAYTLSIPKLGIESANVAVDSEDLSTHLAQYPGTANPGEYGSPVIFGHSVLPQFFSSKNYMTIFSLLPTLEEGDKIVVTYDNVTYTYQVSNKTEVYPDNVTPLAQSYDSKKLKLITCVPPGLKIRRLVVTADLVK